MPEPIWYEMCIRDRRVTEASCTVDGNVTGAIQKGFLVLIGIADTDTTAIADKMIKKLLGLRIFAVSYTHLDVYKRQPLRGR